VTSSPPRHCVNHVYLRLHGIAFPQAPCRPEGTAVQLAPIGMRAILATLVDTGGGGHHKASSALSISQM